ncbi:MAG: SPASM domain-containing protein, partial [Acidobacteria bacterium]|nr:SPASM domain-containing protein [Acidobacteriota bacterium]
HHMATDRAGQLETGIGAEDPSRPLRGCDLLGSRPIQHLHITPAGRCILCCQDYYENWIGGDLNRSSIREVLEGPEMAKLRRWTYGVEEAPADFLCRTCVFAIRD